MIDISTCTKRTRSCTDAVLETVRNVASSSANNAEEDGSLNLFTELNFNRLRDAIHVLLVFTVSAVHIPGTG